MFWPLPPPNAANLRRYSLKSIVICFVVFSVCLQSCDTPDKPNQESTVTSGQISTSGQTSGSPAHEIPGSTKTPRLPSVYNDVCEALRNPATSIFLESEEVVLRSTFYKVGRPKIVCIASDKQPQGGNSLSLTIERDTSGFEPAVRAGEFVKLRYKHVLAEGKIHKVPALGDAALIDETSNELLIYVGDYNLSFRVPKNKGVKLQSVSEVASHALGFSHKFDSWLSQQGNGKIYLMRKGDS